MRPDGVWRTSTHSGGKACVEVATRRGQVAVRDSKDPRGPVLWFEPDTWRAFVGSVAAAD